MITDVMELFGVQGPGQAIRVGSCKPHSGSLTMAHKLGSVPLYDDHTQIMRAD